MQVPQIWQRGFAFGNSIEARRPAKVVRAVTTGNSGTPSATSAGAMKNPKPSETTSTGTPTDWASRTNGTNPASCGCAAAVENSSAGSASTSDISRVMRRLEPDSPASYAATSASQSTPASNRLTWSAMTVSETSVWAMVPS